MRVWVGSMMEHVLMSNDEHSSSFRHQSMFHHCGISVTLSMMCKRQWELLLSLSLAHHWEGVLFAQHMIWCAWCWVMGTSLNIMHTISWDVHVDIQWWKIPMMSYDVLWTSYRHHVYPPSLDINGAPQHDVQETMMPLASYVSCTSCWGVSDVVRSLGSC